MSSLLKIIIYSTINSATVTSVFKELGRKKIPYTTTKQHMMQHALISQLSVQSECSVKEWQHIKQTLKHLELFFVFVFFTLSKITKLYLTQSGQQGYIAVTSFPL